MAVLVLGISSLVMLFTCLIGWIPAIVALCLAPGARRKIAQSGGTLDGDSYVRVGTILSWISIGLTIAGVVLLVILAIAGAFDDDHGTTFDSLGLLVEHLPVG